MTRSRQPGGSAGGDRGWRCQHCSRANDAAARFCPGCGSLRPQATSCPSCSAVTRPGQPFCGQCGTQLLPAVAVSVRPPTTALPPHRTGPVPTDAAGQTSAISPNVPPTGSLDQRTVSAERASVPASPRVGALGRVCVGAAVFLVCATLWTFLAGRLIGPAIFGHTPITQLPRAARTFTYMIFSGIALAGFVGGACAAWWSRGGRGGRRALVMHAGAGPPAAVAILVAISYAARLPIEPRSAATNAVLASIGAMLAAAVIPSLGRRGSREAARRGTNNIMAANVFCVVLFATCTVPTTPDAPASSAVSSSVVNSEAPVQPVDVNDIERKDCALSAQETKFTGGFTLFSVDVGPSWTFAQKKLLDDQGAEVWQDTVAVGLKAGFKVTVGQHLLAGVLGKKAGEGLSISASSHAALDFTSTYGSLSHAKADDVIRWGLDRYGLSALGLPGLTQLVLPTLQSLPIARDVAAPKSSAVKLGGTVTVDFAAGVGISYTAKIDVGASAAVTLENENNKDRNFVKDPDMVELSFGLSAEGSASAQGPVYGLSGHLSGDSVLSMGFKKKSNLAGLWAPDTVKLESTYKISGAADVNFAQAKLGEDAKTEKSLAKRILKALTATNTSELGGSLELTGSVDVATHPDVLAAAAQVINAAQKANKHKASGQDRARYNSAVNNLAALIDKYAVVHGKVYGVSTGTAGIDIEAGDGLAFGASVERESTAETLLGAFFRDPAHMLRASTECTRLP
jgi:hypothetical protein